VYKLHYTTSNITNDNKHLATKIQNKKMIYKKRNQHTAIINKRGKKEAKTTKTI